MSLRGRAVLAFTVSASLVALVLAVSVYSIGRDYMQTQRVRSADRLARAHADVLRPRLRDGTGDEVLAILEPRDGTVLVLHSGSEWFDTDPELTVEQLLPQGVREERTIPTAKVSLRDARYLRVAVPLTDDGDMFYEFTPVTELESNLRMLRKLLVGSAIAATAIGAALGLWASRRVLKPLREVAGAAARIASGELGLRLAETSDRDLSTTVEAFNTMVDSLQQRIERERRLVGDVSHELRTPLTTLITSVSVMNRHADELPDRSRRALGLVSAEVDHLSRMLDDMLALARVEAGVHRGDTEPLSVGELLTHILADREYPAQLLTVTEDVVISGRKLELERAIGNLLDNADWHGGGVAAVCVRRERNDAVVTVDDAGPGVPVADRERIFERFATAHTGRRSASGTGTGIGLALVAETVAAHHGRVDCGDRPGGGARFIIRLPASASSAG
ncbi:HAMP domain-containing histidine kinase [Nocardia sp. NBC_01503]|uniref:sensor histidine kinase n=1 Tax=Nocardia sp. NBC_01503 TaxID=2975997 RepID=UPI002E7B8715|nr:HAMP domain-containing sensor histidine kinase [Nocardia sp. NBC_01503]WTL31009.1 HAMP domain-containing histidine kinase [Nocardia sp. NBC_01503]